MINYSMIQKSELEGALRIDAEYYQPEYLKIKEILSGKNVRNLENISKSIINFGAYSLTSQINYLDEGVPFLQVGNIKDNFIEGKFKLINENLSKNLLKKSLVKDNQVLITIAGTIGNSVVAKNLPKFTNSNQAIANITLENGFNPYYVSTFLNSKYGKLQTKRLIISNVQPNLLLTQVKQLLIPIPSKDFQKEVAGIVKKADIERKKSKELYTEAEEILLKELGLKDYELTNKNITIKDLNEVKKYKRMDAEFFQPKYEELLQVVAKKFKIQKLEEVFSFRRGVFIPTEHYIKKKTGRPYIRIKELSGGKSGIDESKVIFIDEQYSEDDNNILKESDLIVAIIGDTIGKVNKITKELAGGFCSNNTGRLRMKSEWNSKIIPEFSEILFQSVFIQLQIERKKAQTGQPKISDNEIKSIRILILSITTQKKIAGLIQKSRKARSIAKQLLKKAKKAVEIYIEEDEKEGEKILKIINI